jgi:hypothetical protein
MIYFCSQQNRRALVLQHPTLNGIDYLEVCQSGPDCGGGRHLLVTLLKDARKANLAPSQMRIAGGSAAGNPAAPINILSVTQATNQAPLTLTVNLDQPGDFSTFTFTLVANASTNDPPDGFDPQLASVDFSFKAGCAALSDCLPNNCCPPPAVTQPDINYLAKDYDAFVQVMADRMAVLAPGMFESHPSDTGVAAVEILAYAADRLSYQQDAVATEAYLGTARSRISLRRHTKLVDYRIGEGANARAWVYVKPGTTAPDPLNIPAGILLFPRVPGLAPSVGTSSREAQQLEASGTLGFATMQAATLHKEQSEIYIYTWSDTDCCLTPGATEATLVGRFTSLQPGAVLIFEEVIGPDTGNTADADPAKRWAVRLTQVQSVDYLNRALTDPLNGNPITRIYWSADDALPFPVCISSQTATAGTPLKNVSVLRGNVIPADHGLWQDWEDLGTVPAAPPAPVTTASCTCGSTDTVDAVRPHFYPSLAQSPLTFARPFDATAAASAFLTDSDPASPVLTVRDDRDRTWTILDDLLSSDGSQTVAVAEIERDNTVFLRFGDGQYGATPDAGDTFQARYRVGNGTAGNIGRDTLGHIVVDADIEEVRNPLPAAGGTDPETMEHIRQQAPYAFRTQLRAVTEDDYGTMAALDPAIREARGTLRWTGSWYTAFVSVDAAAGDAPTAVLIANTEDRLDLLRMAGVDLAVEGAIVVGLRIQMSICVDPDHFQSDVASALMQVFVIGDLCNGQRGILNPENFTFGETIYTSPLIAAAQAVEGVSTATLTAFQRMDDPLIDGAAQGYLTMGRLEIARCDNDPNRLDHGVFVLEMDGGK